MNVVLSDEQSLLFKARKLDRDALAAIYDQYSPGLFRYAYRLLGDPEGAEDCVAETFSRFLGALTNGGGPNDHLQAYLYRVAHNWATDQFRRQPLPDVPLEVDIHGVDEQNPSQEAEENIIKARVRVALSHLTSDQRQVIVLKYVEGWDNQEIAASLDKPVGAIKSMQHRALQALRRVLLAEDVGDDEESAA